MILCLNCDQQHCLSGARAVCETTSINLPGAGTWCAAQGKYKSNQRFPASILEASWRCAHCILVALALPSLLLNC
jgi:hypothetical protein